MNLGNLAKTVDFDGMRVTIYLIQCSGLHVQREETMTKKLAVLMMILCGSLLAQDYRATIVGTITDPSGASIPNATVKATNAATNSVSETKTNSDGAYTLPFLEPGVYKIEISAAGFPDAEPRSHHAQRRAAPQFSSSVDGRAGHHGGHGHRAAGCPRIFRCVPRPRIRPGQDARVSSQRPAGLHAAFAHPRRDLHPGAVRRLRVLRHARMDVNSSYKFNGARAGNGNNVFMMNGTAISNEGSTWEFAPSIDAIQEVQRDDHRLRFLNTVMRPAA